MRNDQGQLEGQRGHAGAGDERRASASDAAAAANAAPVGHAADAVVDAVAHVAPADASPAAHDAG